MIIIIFSKLPVKDIYNFNLAPKFMINYIDIGSERPTSYSCGIEIITPKAQSSSPKGDENKR